MKHKIILPLLMATLGVNLVVSQSISSEAPPTAAAVPAVAATVDSVTLARTKIDSLRTLLEGSLYTEKQQKAWKECGDRKLDIFAKNRITDRPFHKADSLLHLTKAQNLPPSDPKVQELMQKKFTLQQKWQQKYLLTPEVKRCITVENRRKHLLDSALGANPDYPVWKHLTDPASKPSR